MCTLAYIYHTHMSTKVRVQLSGSQVSHIVGPRGHIQGFSHGSNDLYLPSSLASSLQTFYEVVMRKIIHKSKKENQNWSWDYKIIVGKRNKSKRGKALWNVVGTLERQQTSLRHLMSAASWLCEGSGLNSNEDKTLSLQSWNREEQWRRGKVKPYAGPASAPAFPTAWEHPALRPTNPQGSSTLVSPKMGSSGSWLSAIHGSSPFSSWEITLGLESWYPAQS